MATPSTPAPLSVDEYLKLSSEPECEYLDGLLEPKAIPDYLHARLQTLLIIYLFGKENECNLKSAPELHARISPYRFRIPDVTVLTGTLPTGASPPPTSRHYLR